MDPKKLCPKHCDQKTFLIQKMGSNKFCMQIKFGSKVLGQEEFWIEKVLVKKSGFKKIRSTIIWTKKVLGKKKLVQMKLGK